MRSSSSWIVRLSLVALLGLATGQTLLAQPAPPPDPAPDSGGPPHIFYGAVPPAPPYELKSLVLVFIHGLHGTATDWWGENDMYRFAYRAGYRTAFVSMSLDNTPNDASFEENAAVVTDALPIIASHYNADSVVIVGHSKGGLDAQAAMLDDATRGLVRAVFTISSPNTGTELADWAFGAGIDIAGSLGLLTPGVESLRTATVAAFRALADPVFRSSGIPFYTMTGTEFAGNPVTAITGAILNNEAPGKNDGFVPVARSTLPPDYSSDLGGIKAHHFAVESGTNAFPKINARLQALQFTLREFELIAAAGFGDPHNNWMWAMQWFQGKLYMGTGREIQCLSVLTSDVQTGTNLYPLSVSSGECLPNVELAVSIAAEIWSYEPVTGAWQRAYKSPETIALALDGQELSTARDVGFRGMTVFHEADGTEALYVGGVTSGSVYGNQAQFVDGYPPPRLLRSVDGITFTEVPQPPGTFLGEIGNPLPGSTRPLRSFRALTPYNGMLFATVGDFRGVGVIVASADPKAGGDSWFLASEVTENFPVWNLTVYNNFLYATTGDRDFSDEGFGLYKTNATGPAPYVWTPIITNGGEQSNPARRAPNGLSFAVFQGQLYLGTNRPTELYRINQDDTWDVIVGEPRVTSQGLKAPLSGMGIGFGNWFSGHFWRMAVHEGYLYVTTWDASAGLRAFTEYDKIFGFQYGLDLHRTRDGIHWEAVTRGGFRSGLNTGGRSIVSTPAGLFVGTARPTGGGDIYLCAPDNCTDLQPPALLAPPQLLEAESEETAGRQVSLSWQPVPGAVRYRIYRATVNSLTAFLPGNTMVPLPFLPNPVTLESIRSGQLDFLCTPITPAICDVLDAVKNPDVGLPSPFVQSGIRTEPQFYENAPTAYQSLYFVRAEDAEGNLSNPSNFVGAPSKATPAATDPTPPVISGVLSPAPNAVGWNNANATLTWSVTDPESGVGKANFCGTQTVAAETGPGGVTVTCYASNGKGSSTSQSITIRIDKTPPTISGTRTPAPSRSRWANADVSVVFVCTDRLSGVSSCGPSPQLVTTEGPNQSRQGAAIDLAGNIGMATVEEIHIDRTPPEAVLRFDQRVLDLVVIGADPLSGNGPGTLKPIQVRTVHWGEPRPDDDDEEVEERHRPGDVCRVVAHRAQRRTYHVIDRAGNVTTLTVTVKKQGTELRARVETLQYGDVAPLPADFNRLKLAWASERRRSVLRTLHQWMRVGTGRAIERGEAVVDFSGKHDDPVDSSRGE